MGHRLRKWKDDANRLKAEVLALYLASKDSRTPWYAKVLLALVIGYALSPIDLIPDFIPVLGDADDLVIVPAGLSAVRRMIPPDVLRECRERASAGGVLTTRQKWIGAAIVVLVWTVVLYAFVRLLLQFV